MHEYSIVSALVDQVARSTASTGGRVQKVHVAIGELAGVDAGLLHTAFTTFCPHTVCDGADLLIRSVAAEWRCVPCELALERGALLRCPGCGRPARLAAGDEIILERIELEVPDV